MLEEALDLSFDRLLMVMMMMMMKSPQLSFRKYFGFFLFALNLSSQNIILR